MKQDNKSNQRVDKGWDSMENLLDQKMPQKRRLYFILIFLLTGLAAMMVIPNMLKDELSLSQKSSKMEDFISGSDEETMDSIIEASQNSKKTDKILDLSGDLASQFSNQTKSEEDQASRDQSAKIGSKQSLTRLDNTSELKSTIDSKSDINSNSELSRNIAKKKKPIIDKVDEKRLAKSEKVILVRNQAIQIKPDYSTAEEISISAINSTKVKLLEMVKLYPIPYENVSCLNCAYLFSDIAFAEILPKLKPKSLLNFGVSAGIEYMPSFESKGYSFALDAKRPLNSKWAVSVSLGYNWHKRTVLDGREALENIIPSGSLGADSENNIDLSFADTSKVSYIKGFSNNFNSIFLNTSIEYSLNKNIAIFSGIGLDYYLSKLDLLEDEDGLDANFMQLLSYAEYEKKSLIPSLLIGVSFSFTDRLSIFGSYKYAVTDYYKSGMQRIRGDKINTGLSFKF